MQMISDLDLVSRVQSGDDTAFNELMRRHFRSVVNFVYRFTNNKESSEDLAQDVFLRVYRSIGNFKPEAKFTTWLYRITTNVCITALKSSAKRRELSLDEMQEASQEVSYENAQSTAEYTFRKEIGIAIHVALERLPEREKVAVVLCKYQQMPYDEAAEVIGCSVGAVKAYVYRGRMKLMDILKPYLSEDLSHGA